MKIVLFGGYQHNIDKKGRVFIPAKLREELGSGFMICRGIYGKRCLCVYSAEEWDKLVEKIGTLPSTKSSAVKRFLYDGAFSVDFDSQGRILIPPVLREYANLEGEAHIIGMDLKYGTPSFGMRRTRSTRPSRLPLLWRSLISDGISS